MATLIVPRLEPKEERVWASLGESVAEWLESNAVWGPGSKYGLPVTIDDEFFAFLLRAYQVFPHGHPREGRRRFDLCAQELAKGTGKTERAIIVAQGEFHPTAPVRCRGFKRVGRAWVPVGGAPAFPRLVFMASSEDQVQRTAFGRFKEAMRKSPLAGDYHITQDRIVLVGDDGASAGEAYPLAVSADTADGDLPTWQHIDEPHRWDQNRHHEMFDTVSENQLKDVAADAWTMATSTAGHTGANSLEERLLHTAEAIDRGELEQPGMFFMRRWCPDEKPLDTEEQVEAAVREARGPAAEWSGDIPRIVARYFDPKTNREYWQRVWTNRWVKGAGKAFDSKRFSLLSRSGVSIPKRALVGVGFDGARRRDSTGIVVTDIFTGLQQVAGLWQKPLRDEEWECPPDEVDAALVEVFDRWDVWRFYGDPPYWDDWFPVWEGRWGTDRVIRWWTNKDKPMAHALRRFQAGITGGDLTFVANDAYEQHVANAYRKLLPSRDEEDVELWVIRKERPDSPNKIDLAMAGCLSWGARMDAIASGVKPKKLTAPRRLF